MTSGGAPLRLRVDLPGRATDVVVGAGVLASLDAEIAARLPDARRRLYVVDAGVARAALRRRWDAALSPPARASLRVPGGERAKTRAVAARIEDEVLRRGLTRDDAIVAVGGGAVLDVAGFAAACARRGTTWVAVPTTAVAQADAAVGGKTAVNHPLGKNLLGAFHPPALVVADVSTLRTLSPRDLRCGLAEAYKAGVVGDPGLVARLRSAPEPADPAAWSDLVGRALAVKIRLVERDERDVGARRSLNYGHTVGHALETALGPAGLRHGEAVAVGMGVAAELARARGLVDADFVAGQDAALTRLGLPVRLPAGVAAARLLALVAQDKKRGPGAAHTMVLPLPRGGVGVFADVREAEVRAALRARATRGGAR